MTRRQAILFFLGSSKLDSFLNPAQGCALMLDADTRRVIGGTSGGGASTILAAPGSTLKPFVLEALLRTGRLSSSESFRCPSRLRIGNRELNCSHPVLEQPMRADTALAYSCNCFVAHLAERFAPGQLMANLRRYGFGVQGSLQRAPHVLQALGEEGILVTASEVAMAYGLLAKHAPDPVLKGMEEAVEFGTAQRARVDGVAVAGKTGSAFSALGEPIAWFAGFFPSRNPRVVIAVMLKGRSGGADAAPVAANLIRNYLAGRS